MNILRESYHRLLTSISILLNSAKFCAMQKKQQFAFSAINFYLLAVAIVTVLIGFVLMSGKGSTDTHFDPTIFDSMRTVVAPLICFVGYLFMIIAILYRPKEKKEVEVSADNRKDKTEKAEIIATLRADTPLKASTCSTTSGEA